MIITPKSFKKYSSVIDINSYRLELLSGSSNKVFDFIINSAQCYIRFTVVTNYMWEAMEESNLYNSMIPFTCNDHTEYKTMHKQEEVSYPS